MKQVIRIINATRMDQDVCFVFPSGVAADRWALSICSIIGLRSIAADRFLAWDDFKRQVIRAEVSEKTAASQVSRKLFADALVKKNRETAALTAAVPGFPLRSLIPPQYAESGNIFASSIAKLLPSLALWETKRIQAGTAIGDSGDDEDRDFACIKDAYTAFLNEHDLFEPSWVKPPIKTQGNTYYIFFPEALSDFDEYEQLLETEPAIHLVRISEETAETSEDPYGGPHLVFKSSRAEIRNVVLELRRRYEDETAPLRYEDMALSVADLETMEPYLKRELALYDVPFTVHAGKKLSEYGTGRFFPLVSACVRNHFSFNALKTLLLNEHIPWLDTDIHKRLIEFGIQNNCVVSYREDGTYTDIWEDAFNLEGENIPRVFGQAELKSYYHRLRQSFLAMTNAASFSEIRRAYFAFRTTFFIQQDTETPTRDETNAVLGRCIDELSALIPFETTFKDVLPERPYDFYVSVLRDKEYVFAGENRGVHIYPYKVAAAAPFTVHFVLNAAQSTDATVLYRPLQYLRADKRQRWGLVDTDASAAFFRLYRTPAWNSFVPYYRTSAAEQTFSGWSIPHSFFSGKLIHVDADSDTRDPFRQERRFWEDFMAAGKTGQTPPFPERLFPLQQTGFKKWKSVLQRHSPGQFKYLCQKVPHGSRWKDLVVKKIRAKANFMSTALVSLSVSATDLNKFFTCSLQWLYGSIFKLEKFSLEAQFMDEESKGILYHRILKSLFDKIQHEDKGFTSAHLEVYVKWAGEICRQEVKQHPAFQGPLAVPLLLSQASTLAKTIKRLLKTEALNFDGYTVALLEDQLEYYEGDLRFTGKLDRVSFSPQAEPVIIDYKTHYRTALRDSRAADGTLADFQIPLYIKLYEHDLTQAQVEKALFFRIEEATLALIVGKKNCTRQDYQETMDVLEDYIDYFVQSVKDLDFSINKDSRKHCAGCMYKTICRTTYSLNTRIVTRPLAPLVGKRGPQGDKINVLD
ncbi:PD-(D/E)XK nuclease family protein [Breznakiellaceae bacterium SP9]